MSDDVTLVVIDDPEITTVYVPGDTADLGPITQRVDALEQADVAIDSRLDSLELASGDPEAVQAAIDATLDVHVQDTTPHPAYDDLPSLTLLFENGLV